MEDDSRQGSSEANKDTERRQIIEGNIETILDQFPRIDPQHQHRGGSPRRGFRGGDLRRVDGALELSTRIIYRTATGEICAPPRDFWKEDTSTDFKIGDYSIIDTFLRTEGERDRHYPDSRYLFRLQLSADTIFHPHVFGEAIEKHTLQQEIDHSQSERNNSFLTGDAMAADMHERQIQSAFGRLDEVSKQHAELYRSGPLILPRRLIPGIQYNMGLVFEPWGVSGTSESTASVNPTGDLVMKETLNTFNERYGPDWLKALQSL